MAKLPIFELRLISSRSEIATSAPLRRLKSAVGIFFLLCVGVTTAPAQSFTVLLSFDGANGAFPQGSLVEGPHGTLYGTTPYGGAYGDGTVFEITSNGKLTTLHSFNGTDGRGPYAGLILAHTGNLYGVSSGGGFEGIYGTVFEVAPEGKLTTLYAFCSQPNCSDGSIPYAGLVQGGNGNFYGTTYGGGAHGEGTVFEVTPTGKLSTLHSFCSETNCTDGEAPLLASLVQGSNGNLYGTTPTGGAYGRGIVFEVTPKGKLTTLYSFCSQPNCTDGSTPYAGLVQGGNGDFYGTTYEGGANGYGGTVFEINLRGKLKTLYSFCSQPSCTDGLGPYAGLVQRSNGNFYGTTYTGGANGYGGTVFEITTTGKLTTLYSFCAQADCVDGAGPIAGLMRATKGKLYGATFEGGVYGSNDCGPYGNYGCGTLFQISWEASRP